MFSLKKVLRLLYPALVSSLPGPGDPAVLHVDLLRPEGLLDPAEDGAHLGVDLRCPVLTVRQAVAADPDECLAAVPLEVHSPARVSVTGSSLRGETHLGPSHLHPAPAVAPLPLALLLADHVDLELLEDPGGGLGLTAGRLAPADDRGGEAGVGGDRGVRETGRPELSRLEVRQALQSEEGDVVLVTVVTVQRVDVYLVYAVGLEEVVEVLGSLAAPHHHPQVHGPVLGPDAVGGSDEPPGAHQSGSAVGGGPQQTSEMADPAQEPGLGLLPHQSYMPRVFSCKLRTEKHETFPNLSPRSEFSPDTRAAATGVSRGSVRLLSQTKSVRGSSVSCTILLVSILSPTDLCHTP